MPALIRTDRDALNILFNSGIDDLAHRPVMPEMNNLGTCPLQQAADNVDRRIMAVEQTGCGDKPDAVVHAGMGWLGK